MVRPSPPGPRGVADEDLLARVIDNLLDNALPYVPPNGRIEMEVRDAGDAFGDPRRKQGTAIPAPRSRQSSRSSPAAPTPRT